MTTPDDHVWAIEIKRASAPKVSRGYHAACKDIASSHKWIISKNNDRYPLSEGSEVIGINEFLEILQNQ